MAEGQIEGPLGPLSVLDQVLQGLQDSQNRLKKSLERYNGDYQLKLLLRSSTSAQFSSVSSPGPSPQSLRQKTSGGLWVLRKTGMGSNLGSSIGAALTRGRPSFTVLPNTSAKNIIVHRKCCLPQLVKSLSQLMQEPKCVLFCHFVKLVLDERTGTRTCLSSMAPRPKMKS